MCIYICVCVYVFVCIICIYTLCRRSKSGPLFFPEASRSRNGIWPEFSKTHILSLAYHLLEGQENEGEILFSVGSRGLWDDRCFILTIFSLLDETLLQTVCTYKVENLICQKQPNVSAVKMGGSRQWDLSRKWDWLSLPCLARWVEWRSDGDIYLGILCTLERVRWD